MQNKWLKLDKGVLCRLVPSVKDTVQSDLNDLDSLSKESLNLYKKRKLVEVKLVKIKFHIPLLKQNTSTETQFFSLSKKDQTLHYK